MTNYNVKTVSEFIKEAAKDAQSHLKELRKIVKEIRELVAGGDAKTAAEKLPTAYKAIDKAAKRGVIKDNTAARKKSRLAATIKKAK